MFLGLNRGTNFNSSFLANNGLDDFIRLPMVKESPARQTDFEFSTYLKAVINEAGPKNKFTGSGKFMPDLVNYIQKYDKNWQQFPSTTEIVDALLSELKRLFAAHGWLQKIDANVEEEVKASEHVKAKVTKLSSIGLAKRVDEKPGLGAPAGQFIWRKKATP